MSNKYPNPYAVCQQVGQFEKVSEENYKKIIKHMTDKMIEDHIRVPEFVSYEDIQLPIRKTEGSGGNDFFLTHDVNLLPRQSIVIPTFVRCFIKLGWMLKIYPRSSFGFKYNMKLANTVGIVDSDYYKSVSDGPDNEGHIMIKIVNEGDKIIRISRGERFAQGVFEMYGVTFSDYKEEKETRNGGIGSTGTN